MATFPSRGTLPWDTQLKTYIDASNAQGLVATGGDDTAALNAHFAAASPTGVKRISGSFTVSALLTVPPNTYVDASSAVITTSVSTGGKAITLGSGATWSGGTINSPSTWDGTNTGSAWTAAVISVEGSNATVQGVILNNVPRVGVGVNNFDGVIIRGNHIIGNYPTGQWTGVETNHFGIALEPGNTIGGNIVISGNIVESCVQGIWGGPLDGGGGTLRGISISGNVAYSCWNHGIYMYGANFSVTGNSFNRCQTPIAISGNYHTVTGNSIYTPTTGGTDQRDYTGITMRDSIGCVVVGNTIRGNAPTGGVGIDVRALDGVVVRDNVVADNVIDWVGGTSMGIRMGVSATTCENNTVHDNHLRTVGAANLGAITVSSTSTGIGTKVHDNTVVMLGNGHGIYIGNQDGAVVHDNHVRNEWDSGGAVTLGMVVITGGSTNTYVHDNEFRVSASWGSNITMRAVYELTSATNSRIESNSYQLNPTKLAVATPISIITSANALVNEFGAGAPALAAAPGSQWRRTDGGASTSLYVKETASSSTTWRAV